MSKAIENYIERELNNFRRKNEYDSSCINAFLDTKTYMQINKANERGIIEFCKRTKKEKNTNSSPAIRGYIATLTRIENFATYLLSHKTGLVVAVDFDGTISCENQYPLCGEPVKYAFEVLDFLLKNNCRLILYTMRTGASLQEAVDFCKERNIEFWGINNNPDQDLYPYKSSQKVYSDITIDDHAIGCPLRNQNGMLVVDWLKVKQLFIDRYNFSESKG